MIRNATGGDGWSSWSVGLERGGNYFVVVTSHAEKTASGVDKVVYISEDIRDGQQAISKAISESSAYAQRMYS